jgi:hypothetical protein
MVNKACVLEYAIGEIWDWGLFATNPPERRKEVKENG